MSLTCSGHDPGGAETLPSLRQDAQQERPAPEQAQGKSKSPGLQFQPLLFGTLWTNYFPPPQERKYFDSGDYALSKAGKASDVGVTSIGSRHPVPENIPHLTATSPGANNGSGNGGVNAQGQHIPGSISGHPGSIGFQSRSPAKEGSFLHRGTSMSEGSVGPDDDKEAKELSVSPPAAREGVPIRR